jgi:hypothetical protein
MDGLREDVKNGNGVEREVGGYVDYRGKTEGGGIREECGRRDNRGT